MILFNALVMLAFLIFAVANYRALTINIMIQRAVRNGHTVRATLLRERKTKLIWNVFLPLTEIK